MRGVYLVVSSRLVWSGLVLPSGASKSDHAAKVKYNAGRTAERQEDRGSSHGTRSIRGCEPRRHALTGRPGIVPPSQTVRSPILSWGALVLPLVSVVPGRSDFSRFRVRRQIWMARRLRLIGGLFRGYCEIRENSMK